MTAVRGWARVGAARSLVLMFAIAWLLVSIRAASAAGGLPPRSEWTATASSRQVDALAPAHAIDGDPKTRWGGTFSADHWLQVDLGRIAEVAGVAIQWDSGFAVSWAIQTSTDGEHWQVAYTSLDSRGDHDYVFFPATDARYLRLASLPRTADWGISVFEFTPLSTEAAVRLSDIAGAGDGRDLFDGEGRHPAVIAQRGERPDTRVLSMTVPADLEIAGLEVWWDGPRDGATLEARTAAGWRTIADDPGPLGEVSWLAAREPLRASQLRLTVGEDAGQAPMIRRLRLLGPRQLTTPLRRYEVAASRAHRDLFPSSLHQQQVYWTTVGVPAGRQKSLFDEYGNLEAFKGAPMVQALWRDASGAASSDMVERRHALRERWMPMPSVAWSPTNAVTVRNEAFAYRQADQPVTLVRYTVRNEGKVAVEGDLSLLVRPLQVNPPWQHGGVSRIDRIAIEDADGFDSVRVNGRRLLVSLDRPTASGTSGFGAHGEGELTAHAAAGSVPAAREAHDGDGLAAGMLRYRLALAPGAEASVVVAFPLGDQPTGTTPGVLPEPPALDVDRLLAGQVDADSAFEAMAARVAGEWRARFAGFDLRLPDESIVDAMRAQAASMMLNQTGHAMQPGPRNYNRSFIRDGQATASILARMGQPAIARDYLRWYTDHALNPDGMVSPILNEDGSINRGFGSDIEYDSQGQYILLVADLARFDGGPETVREYLPAVKQAMRFLQVLRERTLVPGYMGSQPAPARFHGIIAPSISHEGYSTPTHSYWDDYFAIKGWDDGAWLAAALGDEETARWARGQGDALRRSVADSIRQTIAWKGSDTLPASADLGESDPTSVSIALDPTGAQDVLPPRELSTTFERYLADVRRRDEPGALYAYTPYELRNVLTYVHLGQPAAAYELLQRFRAQQRPKAWLMWPEVVHSRERHPGYIGDMPHTWIGSEYVRAVFGMLVGDTGPRLVLLPGAPAEWLAGNGLVLHGLPTAFGRIDLRAARSGEQLRIELSGVADGTAVELHWPGGITPRSVHVDGRPRALDGAGPLRLERPFHTLEASW